MREQALKIDRFIASRFYAGVSNFLSLSKSASWPLILFGLIFFLAPSALQGADQLPPDFPFPKPLGSYQQPANPGVLQTIVSRAREEPLNAIATFLFFCAIVHTFLAPFFMKLSHRWQHEHRERIHQEGLTGEAKPYDDAIDDRNFKAEIFHFLGEVEAVFGIWIIPLLLALTWFKGWAVTNFYLSHTVSFTEPIFVVVIMSIASTRPILKISEQAMAFVARLAGGSAAAWWWSLLTLGPLLGSLITEPAAITICALLLAQRFYGLKPSPSLAYATLGLLFVNISVGGTLTNFAAPPVLMVAATWGWSSLFMLSHIGWKAVVGIVLANFCYFLFFRRELKTLGTAAIPGADKIPVRWEDRGDPVPLPLTLIHLFFLAWTVFNAHNPALFVGGFLFFLAFTAATEHHQNPLLLRPAILVGFFLAGLVVHGGFQTWWLEPILGSLGEVSLLFGCTILTSFNDNAAITYLASLVPSLTEGMKHAVVEGAVAGGGLTVIANAPNPAGQSILSKYFGDGVSPLKLAAGALLPTAIMVVLFLLF